MSLLVVVLPIEGALAANFDGEFATSNDFGDVGLLQTPSARMRADGEFGIGISTNRPYNQAHLFLQPLPWLETAARFTEITDRRYGPESFSGNQSYKDKSADVKLRLVSEGIYRPSIVFGIQDVGGTGVFSSEYVAASYHFFDFDFSAGLGWGRLGSRGGLKNPLTLFSSHFNRERSTDASGSSGISNLLTGRDIGPFGGVQWNTPLKGLSLQIEYDGNDYQHEGLGIKLAQSTPINVALNYRGSPGVDVGIGYERGHILTARLSLHFNFQNFLGIQKFDDPAIPLIRAKSDAENSSKNVVVIRIDADASAGKQTEKDQDTALVLKLSDRLGAHSETAKELSTAEKSEFVLQLKAALKPQGFELAAVNFNTIAGEIQVWLTGENYRNPAKSSGRVARILSAIAPSPIQRFTIVEVEHGVEIYWITIARDTFEKFVRGETGLGKLSEAIVLKDPENGLADAQYFDRTPYPGFNWDMGPSVRQYLGGPDNFYIGQLYWKVQGTVNVTEHLSISGEGGINIYNNFSKLKQPSNSELPHVRSDIIEYLKQGKNDLVRLDADYIWSPAPELYARVSGGIFEEMYAGVSAELLYHPYGKPIAIGLDINRVVQRGFDQLLDFRDYSVSTGHLTVYYHLPFYNLLAKVSVGRYLARDKGGTVDLSRKFANGIRAGIFATKTNVSSAQFGEGRFDKGLYLNIPLDLFFTQSTRREANILFRPLTRDGGQKVSDGQELYPIVDDGRPEDFAEGWNDLLR